MGDYTCNSKSAHSKCAVLILTATLILVICYALSLSNSIAAQRDDDADINSVVLSALDAWRHGEWESMYTFMSKNDRDKTPLNDFVKKREEIALAVKLKEYKVLSIDKISTDHVKVKIELTTLQGPNASFFPTNNWNEEKSDVVWNLSKEDCCWKLNLSKN